LKIFYEIFIWVKDIEIKKYKEKNNTKKMRKFPYYIINILWKDYSKTLLISNQIWEVTFVYNLVITPEHFVNVEKWEELYWVKPIKVIYNKNYSNNLKKLLAININEHKEIKSKKLDYKDKNNIIELLNNVTDEEWKKIEIDLTNIWLEGFKKLNFWDWTRYRKISWSGLLQNNWWENSIALKKILELWWIKRWDLWLISLNFDDWSELKVVLSIATDKKWNKIEPDLTTIWMKKFSKLYFWYGTDFWIFTWQYILLKNWPANKTTLKKVLKKIWVERNDLASKDIDYNNITQIKELISKITDKDWNIIDEDFYTLWVEKIKELYFWKGTRFWKISWRVLLKNNWGVNNVWLMNILKLLEYN
jgi:hypothetical protein